MIQEIILKAINGGISVLLDYWKANVLNLKKSNFGAISKIVYHKLFKVKK